MIAGTALAAALAPGTGLAQERKSLVTTQVEVSGEVRRKLSFPSRIFAASRSAGGRCGGGYAGNPAHGLARGGRISKTTGTRCAALRRSVRERRLPGGIFLGELFNSPIGRSVLVASSATERAAGREGRIALVSLADERRGPRHVKWLSRIDVRRVPE